MQKNWSAIQQNEVEKRHIHDDVGVGKTSGPAQLSEAKVAELRKKFGAQLDSVDPNTVGGGQKFAAAFMVNEADKFERNWYGNKAGDMGVPEETWQKYAQIQNEWNEAVAKGDRDATRKLRAARYNPGNPNQADEVEAERDRVPSGSALHEIKNEIVDLPHNLWTKITSWL